MTLLDAPSGSHPSSSIDAVRSLNRHQQLGMLGESMAVRYLEMRGYRLLARNWRHKFGELDIIALDGCTLVAVEVKTRRGTGYGHPLESITVQKVGRLKALVAIWAAGQDRHFSDLRVDAMGIVIRGRGDISFDHRESIA